MAELWAIRFGLQLAQNKGFNHLIVETDSQLAYNWLLTNDSNYPPLLTNLICDCRYLVQVGTQPHLLKNVYKEDNRVADALAEREKTNPKTEHSNNRNHTTSNKTNPSNLNLTLTRKTKALTREIIKH